MKTNLSKGQVIKHSRVGVHHNNALSENSIKSTICNAPTMMIHSVLSCPEHNESDIWTYVIIHVAYFHNDTPHMLSRLSPTEVCSRSKSSHRYSIYDHPWVCPMYVLQPWIQGGGKLPMWESGSRRGQYMGVSPLHAGTVGIIRNLNTDRTSTQFHVV